MEEGRDTQDRLLWKRGEIHRTDYCERGERYTRQIIVEGRNKDLLDKDFINFVPGFIPLLQYIPSFRCMKSMRA